MINSFYLSNGSVTPASYTGLNKIYERNGFRLFGTSDFFQCEGPDAATNILFGRVVGWRSDDGKMSPVSGEELQRRLLSATATEFKQKAEGSFVLFSFVNDQVEVVSDVFGKRDIYYKGDGSEVEVSSSLEYFSENEKIDDKKALIHTLTVYGNRPAKKDTLDASISRLGVREVLRVTPEGKFEISEFEPELLDSQQFDEKQLEEYSDIFLDAIEIRGSEVGNIVFLSSGWDSTAILAGLVEVFGKSKVRGVIGRLNYSKRSGVINQFELDRAEAIARHYDVDLEVVDLDYSGDVDSVVKEYFPLLKKHDMFNCTALNWLMLGKKVKEIRKQGEVVFSGEISDALHNIGFAQYTGVFHQTYGFREYSDKMMSYLFGPTFYKTLAEGSQDTDQVFGFIKSMNPNAILDDYPKGLEATGKMLLESFFLRSARIPGMSLENIKMLSDEGRNFYQESMGSYFSKHNVTPDNIYSCYLDIYSSFHWQGATIASLSYSGDYYDFDMELPFWDTRLLNLMSRAPEYWGRGLEINNTKYPLKWFLKNRVKDYPFHLQTGPHSYLYDVDHSFSLGDELLFASGFTPVFKEALSKRKYKENLDSRHFNIEYIDSLVDQYLEGGEFKGQQSYDLLSLSFFEAIRAYG